MEFFAPWMLLGLAAISVPVLIHLFNRKSAKTVLWGAYRFLLDSMFRRRKRMLIEEMLLLATRCLLLALLALALARPFIKAGSRVPWGVVLPMLLMAVTCFGVSFAMWRYPKWRYGLFALSVLLAALAGGTILLEHRLNLSRFGAGLQRDVVIVIDGSSSMTMRQGAEANFDRARSEAEAYIKEAARDTAFGIIVGGPVAQVMMPAPSTDRRELFRVLDTLRPVNGTMDIMNTLSAAAVMLASGSNPLKQIVIVGDGQSAGWHLTAPERWNVITAVFEQFQTKPQIIWRTLPLPPSIRNVGIADITLSREIIGTDRAAGIRVTLANTGSEAVTPEAVTLTIGDTVLTNRMVQQLAPGTSHSVTFLHPFERVGAQPILARVIASDDLPADDTQTHIVQVVDALRVLIVDGNPVPNPRDRASTYLALALRPETVAAASLPPQSEPREFLIDPEVIDAPAVARREGFMDCSAVILADVPSLPEQTAERLARFVANGGGLFIAPGVRAQTNFYNTWTLDGEAVLPLPLHAFVLSPETNRPSVKPASFIYDALHNFRSGNDLGSVVALRHWQMDTAAAPGNVAASFDNDDPFLAVRRLGRGTVVLSAIPFDASVSTLPSRSSFLPLAHELTYHLANPSMARLNLTPLQGATLLLSGGGSAQSDLSARGLQALYYSRADFSGRSFGRVDPLIDFNFDQTPPIQRLGTATFSVRWTGSLIPRFTAEYEVWLDTNSRATLRIDGQTAENRRYALRANQPHAITIEFEKTAAHAPVRLFWRSARQPHEVIPQDRLSPYRTFQITAQVGEPAEVVDAGGNAFQAHYVQTTEGLALRMSNSLQPGTYTASIPALLGDELRTLADAEGRIPFNVKAGIEESDIATVTQQDIAFLRTYIDLLIAQKPEEVNLALVGETFGKEIWRTLAYAALFLLVLEILLTRWIAVQRRTGMDETMTFEDTSATASEAFRQELDLMRKGRQI